MRVDAGRVESSSIRLIVVVLVDFDLGIRSCSAVLTKRQSSLVGKMLFLLVPQDASLSWWSSVRSSCHVGDKEEGDGKWRVGQTKRMGGVLLVKTQVQFYKRHKWTHE